MVVCITLGNCSAGRNSNETVGIYGKASRISSDKLSSSTTILFVLMQYFCFQMFIENNIQNQFNMHKRFKYKEY
jgi:hypothetical protein